MWRLQRSPLPEHLILSCSDLLLLQLLCQELQRTGEGGLPWPTVPRKEDELVPAGASPHKPRSGVIRRSRETSSPIIKVKNAWD